MREKQTATLPPSGTANGRNWSGQRELVDRWQLVASDGQGGLSVYIDARCWMGRSSNASTVYGTIWAHYGKRHFAGNGAADGYGYCKLSGAIDMAIRSAGIKLGYSIHGAGEEAVKDAMHAIADALGIGHPRIIV